MMSKWDDWVEISTTKTALHNGDAPEFFQRAGDWIDELQAQLDNMDSSDNLFNEVKTQVLQDLIRSLDDDRAAALQLMVERGPDHE
jgi:hypothetical protein